MENKIEELKAMGIDITSIIKGTKDEKLLKSFSKVSMYSDIVIPEWSEEDLINFSNRVYNIVIKDYSYEKIHNSKVRGDEKKVQRTRIRH